MINFPQISKNINMLTKENKIEEAIELCKKYEENPNIQSQYIKILVKQKDYKEALRICDLPQFEDLQLIQLEKAKILLELKRYNDALRVINNPIFENSERAEELRNEIKNNQDRKYLSELYTRVYLDIISLDEINNSNIDNFKKLVLKMLYYEKHKLPFNLAEIKNAKRLYGDDKEILNALNEFYSKFQNKKFLYINYSLYSSLLNVGLNDELIEKHNNEKTYEFKKPKKVVIESVKKVEHKEIIYKIPKKIVTEQKVESDQYVIPKNKKNKNSIKQNNVKTGKVKKENKPIDLEKIKIKDVFQPEIIEIQKYLYVQMNLIKNKKTIDIWDKFSVLIEKSLSDYNALSRFISIATIVNNNCSYISIDTELLNNKKLRYKK